jgi:hypothetical protein
MAMAARPVASAVRVVNFLIAPPLWVPRWVDGGSCS